MGLNDHSCEELGNTSNIGEEGQRSLESKLLKVELGGKIVMDSLLKGSQKSREPLKPSGYVALIWRTGCHSNRYSQLYHRLPIHQSIVLLSMLLRIHRPPLKSSQNPYCCIQVLVVLNPVGAV